MYIMWWKLSSAYQGPQAVSPGGNHPAHAAARLVDSRNQRHPLLGAGVETGRDVPARDDQGVAAVHREGVPERDHERVLEDDALGGGVAEGAGRDAGVSVGGRRHQDSPSCRA
jgi:hypothetical protein